MDTAIWVNGQRAGEWKYGYSTFEIDLTPFVKAGENEILVSVNFRSPNSRWYSGAGIYRDVWFKETPKTYIRENGVYVHTEACGEKDGKEPDFSSMRIRKLWEMRGMRCAIPYIRKERFGRRSSCPLNCCWETRWNW